jgi:hypothetical protein
LNDVTEFGHTTFRVTSDDAAIVRDSEQVEVAWERIRRLDEKDDACTSRTQTHTSESEYGDVIPK